MLPRDPVPRRRRLEAARAEIEERYADALSLEMLARSAGFSPYHFQRVFLHEFGETPHEYLTSVRIARAKDLLARDAPVTDVCFDVGYSSLGSFSILFSRKIGCSPRAFQRRLRRVVAVSSIRRVYIPCCFVRFFLQPS